MNKRKNIIILSRCMATILLFVCVFGCVSATLEGKESRDRFQEFYEQQENFDVLILGTSHAFRGISPMDMWEQNGIVAYNLGASGCRIPSSYWMLKNALQYTNPKLVVLDCAYLLDNKTNDNINYMHMIFDSMPFGRIKIEALMDLYDQKEDIERFLFSFSLYHNRWDELVKEDFFYKPVCGKMGLWTGCEVVSTELPDFSVSQIEQVDNVSTQYLEEIIELCEVREIELLLTFLPFDMNDASKNDAAFVRMFAQQRGIPYLGPAELTQCINPKTDFKDSSNDNSHLNLSGAHKMSYYLGDFITNNFSIPDQRNNPLYDDWNQYYSLYEDYKLSLLKEQTCLEHYLVGMADKNYTCAVYINDAESLQNELVENLLANLGMRVNDEMSQLLVRRSEDTWMKDAQIRIAEDRKPVLFLNNERLHCWDIPVTAADIFVVVMDNSGETVLDTAAFSGISKEKIVS